MIARLVILVLLCSLSRAISAPVKLGNEVLAEDHFKALAGKRVGLITNPSGVNRQLKTTIDLLRSAPNVQLCALFGAEHGVYGDVAAGDLVGDTIDPRTGIKVFSLYKKGTDRPTPEMLKGLDAVVYDLQDIGCRSYTFITTMGLAMQSCAESGVEFIVLDRPNPLGGERVEGPIVEDNFRSSVSKWPVPYLYGLTGGELARMINEEGWLANHVKAKLTVVPMKGWKRNMIWTDTGLSWVPASPHIPHADSPFFYPATGVMGELLSVNIGVGYPLPFECIAIPGADMHKLSDALNAYELPGVFFKPISYKPYYNTHKDKAVYGAQIYFTYPRTAPLLAINLYGIEALRKTAGYDAFAEAQKAHRGFRMFDNVIGSDTVRKQLQAGTPAAQIVQSWKSDEESFKKARRKYLLY